MKISIPLAIAIIVSLAANSFAQDQVIDVSGRANRLISINISGFTGEPESVLKFDLSVLGMEETTADQADYLISGSAGGSLEGHLKAGHGGAEILSRIYSGGNGRTKAHSFADDIVKAIRDTPPIFQSRIAYCQNMGSGNIELFVSDYDGHDAKQVTDDKSLVATPCWSPGGHDLYYTSWRTGFTKIIEQDAATGRRSVFSGYGGGDLSPAVSPDGRKVAMILGKGGSPNLYVCNSDGGDLRELTSGRDDISSPTWSPDSREICYVERSGRALLRKISVNGGASTKLSVGIGANMTSPDWSPDGKWIIFTVGSANFTLYKIPAGGGDATELVPGEDPCWAPNSRTVIFTRKIRNEKILSLLDVPTKHVKDVGQISGSRSQPAWAR